jgi:hypothetical protein
MILGRLGGLLGSTLSCILFAELAVGRVILARKLSSRTRELWRPTRDRGRSCCSWAGRHWRDGCLRRLEVVGAVNRDETSGTLVVVEVECFFVKPDEAVFVLLGDREMDPALAADDTVGATVEARDRTERVGDFC